MASTWQKKLRTASFRKIRFKIVSSDASFGRRTVNHEYAKRDEPYQEDLGRKSRSFQVEGYVLGFDYLRQRDRLIAACETEGPGDLVHPYYGTKKVVCTGCEVRESAGDGGIARFQITFAEAGKLAFPVAKSDSLSKLSSAAQALKDAANAAFGAIFTVLSYPQFVADAAEAKVNEIADFLSPITNGITEASDKISDFADTVATLKIDAISLIQTPALLAARLDAAISEVANISLSKREVFGAYEGFFTFGDSDSFQGVQTPSREQERTNSSVSNSFTQIMATSNGSVAAAQIDFTSIEDAMKIQQSLFDVIDAQAEITNDDDVYLALMKLRAEVANSIPSPAKSLPSIFTIQNSATLPSIVIAYDLYESLKNEQDIIDRNSVQNPAFVMGGIPLKVLSNV